MTRKTFIACLLAVLISWTDPIGIMLAVPPSRHWFCIPNHSFRTIWEDGRIAYDAVYVKNWHKFQTGDVTRAHRSDGRILDDEQGGRIVLDGRCLDERDYPELANAVYERRLR